MKRLDAAAHDDLARSEQLVGVCVAAWRRRAHGEPLPESTLNLSDGKHSLLDIAERANLSLDVIASVAAILEGHSLLAASSGERRSN